MPCPLVGELHTPVLRIAITRAARLPSPPSVPVLPWSALGSRLSALLSQSQRFPLTRRPAFAYKGLARLESEMASPAENPKAVSGEASRHTCNAPPLSCTFDRPNFFAPTGHHARERCLHAALAAQHSGECSSGRTHLRCLCIGKSAVPYMNCEVALEPTSPNTRISSRSAHSSWSSEGRDA